MKNEAMLKKLLALSKYGVEGEKANAQKILDKLLKKYEIDLEDLSEEDERKHRDLWYENEYELRLLNQLYYAFYPDRESWNYVNKRYKKARHTMIFDLTDTELLEFEYAYEVLKNSWYKELDVFYSAFIQKNQLFPKPEDAKKLPGDDKKIDFSELMKMQSYANGIDTVSIRKAIE